LVTNSSFEKAVFEIKFELPIAFLWTSRFAIFRDKHVFELAVFESPYLRLNPPHKMCTIDFYCNLLCFNPIAKSLSFFNVLLFWIFFLRIGLSISKLESEINEKKVEEK